MEPLQSKRIKNSSPTNSSSYLCFFLAGPKFVGQPSENKRSKFHLLFPIVQCTRKMSAIARGNQKKTKKQTNAVYMALNIDDPTFNPSIHFHHLYNTDTPSQIQTHTAYTTPAQRPQQQKLFKETAIHFRLTLKAFNQMAISKSEQSLAETKENQRQPKNHLDYYNCLGPISGTHHTNSVCSRALTEYDRNASPTLIFLAFFVCALGRFGSRCIEVCLRVEVCGVCVCCTFSA